MNILKVKDLCKTYIVNKRQKIEDTPKNPKRIVTVWGVGYQYEGV